LISDSEDAPSAAAPAPCTARAAISSPMAGTRPQAAEARVNTANPAISRRLRPDLYPSAPADKISAANTSV
jgi:hypothetical protein